MKKEFAIDVKVFPSTTKGKIVEEILFIDVKGCVNGDKKTNRLKEESKPFPISIYLFFNSSPLKRNNF